MCNCESGEQVYSSLGLKSYFSMSKKGIDFGMCVYAIKLFNIQERLNIIQGSALLI